MLSFGAIHYLKYTVVLVGTTMVLSIAHAIIILRGAPAWYPSSSTGVLVTMLPGPGFFVATYLIRRKYGTRALKEKSGLCKRCAYPPENTIDSCPECGLAYLPEERIDDPEELAKAKQDVPDYAPGSRQWTFWMMLMLGTSVVALAFASTAVLRGWFPQSWSREWRMLAGVGAMFGAVVVPFTVFGAVYYFLQRAHKKKQPAPTPSLCSSPS